MASKDYLFVNKDSRSPSLSRNTGTEASLASRVNKHVQQQRFWRSSGPRRSWYRPFVRSDSSSSAPSPTRTDVPLLDDSADSSRRVSSEQHSPRPLRRSISSVPASSTSQRASAVSSHDQPRTPQDARQLRGRWVLPPELMDFLREPGNSIDPFTTVVVPLTPVLVEAIQKHLKWALSASVTNFAVEKGVQRVFSVILQDKMHAAAFLSMVTAQQKRSAGLAFPHDQGPELYSYRATKLIREHIESHKGSMPSYTFVDIFRLAMCEWINGNPFAARIHISYISKTWHEFKPKNPVDHHVLEVCSTEDIFLAIDVNEKPLLDITWEPDLFIGPQPWLVKGQTSTEPQSDSSKAISIVSGFDRGTNAQHLEDVLRRLRSPISEILHDIMKGLSSFPRFPSINFGSALTGPIWVMKRRLHAAIHRLQSLNVETTTADDSIRRALLMILVLASTTPERRVVRVDMSQLAVRLKTSLTSLNKPFSTQKGNHLGYTLRDQLQDPGLWLWMYVVGLTAAKDPRCEASVRQWYTKRAVLLAIQLCGPFASSDEIRQILSAYLYFEHPLGRTVEFLSAAVFSSPISQNPASIDVDEPQKSSEPG